MSMDTDTKSYQSYQPCGHSMQAHGFGYTCDRPLNHHGWHKQTRQLSGGASSTTNWGDDGLAIWASSDNARRLGRGGSV